MSRHRHSILRWPALLATIALATATIPGEATAQEQTARLVKDLNTAPLSYGVGITWIAPLGESVVFTRTFPQGGPELWISDGTTHGTLPIRQAPLGPEDWTAINPVSFGEGEDAKVAFYRFDTLEGEFREVWVTDGTDAGTLRVAPSTDKRYIHSLTATTDGVFFIEGYDTAELIFSDGTQAGTRSLNPSAEETPTRFTAPTIAFTSGAWCYFTANTNEIWRSDGTEAGTTKIATFPLTGPGYLSAWAAGTQMFVAFRQSNLDNQRLWSCPLEGGTITHLYPPAGVNSWRLDRATTLGGQFFFLIRDADNAHHLMASDGTVAGTREIPVPIPAGDEFYDLEFTRWHGALYGVVITWSQDTGSASYTLNRIDGTNDELTSLATFNAQVGFYAETAWREQEDFLYFGTTNAENEWELWQTAGTAATTHRTKNIPARHYLRAEQVAGTGTGIYYSALGSANTSGLSLWLQRGKSRAAVRLTRPEKWTASGIPYFWWYPHPYKSLTYDMFEGRLLSFARLSSSTADDHELWSMNPDGSRAKAFWRAPGPMDGNDALFGFWGTTPVGSIFYYSDGHDTRRVYRTNGARGGTRIMKDHSTGPDQGVPYGFAQSGDQVFYSVSTSWGSPDTSLWKTDGTPRGTTKIVAADGTAPRPVLDEKMPSFQGSLYFLAHGPGAGETLQLWRTDGTPAGTIMLKDTWENGTPTELTVAGGKLLFNVSFYRSILWQSDGTAAGTIPVPGAPSFAPENPATRFVDLGNGVVLFQAAKTVTEFPRWWRHDATGTTQVPVTMTGTHFFHDNWDQYHAVLGNKVIYYAYDSENDDSLWITDGTAAGTHRIAAPDPAFPTSATEMLTIGNHVYFSGHDAAHGKELWRTDGTAAGTVLVADICPGNPPFSSSPYGLKFMDGKLYFTAYRNDVGQELFVIDLPQH